MWKARTKDDLIIEVWEKLDCENVGAAEIEAIETAVAGQFGEAAVDSPMMIARLLASEGAYLRHSEIMKLYLARVSDRPYDPALRNILKIDDLKSAAASIRNLENLRQKYISENDKAGLRIVRETAVSGKHLALEKADKNSAEPTLQQMYSEIAQWFTVWLQTPEVFEGWLALRQRSPEFTDRFGPIRG